MWTLGLKGLRIILDAKQFTKFIQWNLHVIKPAYLIEQNQNKIQSNPNRLIRFGNQTWSNIYFALSLIYQTN